MAMSSISNPPGLLPFLRTPGVAAFLTGRFVAAMGVWCERIAVGWLIWDLTQSPGLLGTAVFLRLAPALVLSPLGGVLADRHGAVGLLRGAHAINAAIALALALFALTMPLWAILACTVALGVVQALAAAPLKSVVPQVLAREELPMAIPLSSATFNLAGFIGPAVAGATIALVGLWAAFAVSVVGCLVFFFALGRWAGTDAPGTHPVEGVFREIGAAVVHVRDDPALRPLFLLHLAAACCLRPFIDLLPAYVGASGASGAAQLGLATSAIGGGAVVGALWMAVSAEGGRLVRRLLTATLVAIVTLLALAYIDFSAAGAAARAALWCRDGCARDRNAHDDSACRACGHSGACGGALQHDHPRRLGRRCCGAGIRGRASRLAPRNGSRRRDLCRLPRLPGAVDLPHPGRRGRRARRATPSERGTS